MMVLVIVFVFGMILFPEFTPEVMIIGACSGLVGWIVSVLVPRAGGSIKTTLRGWINSIA